MAAVKGILKDNVVDNNEEKITEEQLFGSGKVLGLYFSAHWCPTCRQFTPVLVQFYNKVKALKKEFEIVFVSSDKSETDFKKYYETMPWKACSLGKNDDLSELYGVSGIPTLVLLDGEGEIITKDGRSVVAENPEGKGFPWK